MSVEKRLLRSAKNLSFLVTGNFLSQIISMVGFILISGYLSRKELGIYAIVTSFVGFFLVFTLPQINKVLIRKGVTDEKNLDNILSDSFGFRLLVGWIAMIICIVTVVFMNYDLLTKALILVYSISLMLTSVNSYYLIIYQVHEKMQFYSIVEVVQKSLYFLFTIIVVVLDLGLVVLMVASLISLGISVIINIRLSKRFIEMKVRLKFRIKWDILKPTIIFSLLLFLTYMATQIDILMISVLRIPDDVAVYKIALTLIEPGYVLRNLVFIATFPMFIKIYSSKDSIQINKLFIYGIILGIVVLIGAGIVSLFSEFIIGLIFPKYGDSLSPAIFSVLIFFLGLKFFELPFYNALQATGNEKKLLLIYWIPPIVNIVLNLVFLQWFGLIGIAYSTIAVGVVSVGLLVIMTVKILHHKEIAKEKMGCKDC